MGLLRNKPKVPPVSPAPETPDERLAFKRRAGEVLHGYANREDWCSEFDRVLSTVGLPTRVRAGMRVEVVGEETPEEFERWRRRTVRILHYTARRRSMGPWHLVALAEAGLGKEQDEEIREVEVRVEGTFSVKVPAQVLIRGSGKMDPEALTDAVDRLLVRDKINHAFSRTDTDPEQLSWRVVEVG